MAIVNLTEREQVLREVIGGKALLKGRQLARTSSQLAVEVDVRRGLVTGSVLDEQDLREARVQLRHDANGRLTMLDGWCTCGLGAPRAHSVALVLTADPSPLDHWTQGPATSSAVVPTRLAEKLEVVCRDGSVTLPEARPPLLGLTVTGLGGHLIALDWAWVYWTRRRTSRTTRPPGTGAPGSSPLPSRSRSPGPRWRTT